ncbi:undecaprenyl-phosphate glucose phosphotransferase [Pseudomonas orientalis]|uniref:Undecaprenyl-phosphate glucose phosphotransferase n=1 Tax=Pseudomonas orientalis TaxID=76758 RepID=A0A1H2DTZ9_9PSED|nr:undecaprenyl-phosphate glucose phosphotransferase [Pseudomonas orientalis]KRP59639.1 capsular biosynthesis protein [Pseudomonas orientalis]SDT86329.1 Undecaprenyl-phosphate glucose phosphotransferase [Pseudomonas orientalis]
MREKSSVVSLFLTRAGFVEFFVIFVKLIHGLTAILPPLVLAFFIDPMELEMRSRFLGLLLFFAFLTIILFQALGIYSEELFSNRLRLRAKIVAWSSAFCILLFMYQILQVFPQLNPRNLVAWYFASLGLFCLERMMMLRLYRSLMRRGKYLQRTVLLGFTDTAVHIADHLQRNGDIRSGLIGFIDDRTERIPKELSNLPLLGNTRDLEKLIRAEQVNQVMICLPWSAEQRILGLVNRLRQMSVNVMLVPDMAALRYGHSRITDVGGILMFNTSQLPLRGWAPFIKRCEDLLLASIALVVLSPVMLLTAIAIKLDSKGPVLFRQNRFGYNDNEIRVFKFRSMFTDQSDFTAERQTTRQDPRITRVGRIIRKTSIDELPQLFNVLLGNMSMVGPRPHATATKAAGIPFELAVSEYSSRHRVKPGITGWAQINGYRGETDTLIKIQKRVEYDLEYISKWSVWFDLYIVFMTVPAVLSTKEVY